MRILLLLLISLLILPLNAEAQKRKKKKKDSNAKGTFYGHWGYNRSAYTKSDINFVGKNYDFTLNDAVATDNPEEVNLAVYLNPQKITIPQFNARIGYFFRNNWSVSFGYDHMKYVLADKNKVLVDGTIGADVPDTWLGPGTYNKEPVVTDRKLIHYENSDGLNYFRFGLTRSDRWYKTKNKNGWFAINSDLGLGTGFILPFNDFTFAGVKTQRTKSISGYGISAHAHARFDFFNHVYLRTGVSGGFHNQLKVRNRPKDPYTYTKQKYGYIAIETVVGFILYLKPTNGCGTCPKW